MRRILIVLLVLVACLALGIPNVSARDHGRDHRKGEHRERNDRRNHDRDSHRRGSDHRFDVRRGGHSDGDHRNGRWDRWRGNRTGGSHIVYARGYDNRGRYHDGRGRNYYRGHWYLDEFFAFSAGVVVGSAFYPRGYYQSEYYQPEYYPPYGQWETQQVPVYDRWGNFIGYQPRQAWGSYQYQRPYGRQY